MERRSPKCRQRPHRIFGDILRLSPAWKIAFGHTLLNRKQHPAGRRDIIGGLIGIESLETRNNARSRRAFVVQVDLSAELIF